MSRTDATSTRYRLYCPDCEWRSAISHRTELSAQADVDRHNEDVHDGETLATVEAFTEDADDVDRGEGIVADGGRDRVDPENLPRGYTPAFVQVRNESRVFVADYETLDSQWLRVTHWDRRREKLPPHRVKAVREVRRERVRDADTDETYLRLVDEDRREQARPDEEGVEPVVADD